MEINLNMQNHRFLMEKSQENRLKPHFGPILDRFSFQKSEFLTFLDLLKANLMQKNQKKTNGGK